MTRKEMIATITAHADANDTVTPTGLSRMSVAQLREEIAAITPDSQTITILAAENPKREGSKSHARFALYATTLTVDGYLDAAHALQGRPRHIYRADLRWDVTHGFIKLSEA